MRELRVYDDAGMRSLRMRGCAVRAPGGPLSPGGRGLETRAAHIIGGSVSFAHLHSEAASSCAPLYIGSTGLNVKM